MSLRPRDKRASYRKAYREAAVVRRAFALGGHASPYRQRKRIARVLAARLCAPDQPPHVSAELLAIARGRGPPQEPSDLPNESAKARY